MNLPVRRVVGSGRTPRQGIRPRRNLLIWLSGADVDTLLRTPRERRKFVGLGGVVLTTSTLAAVSATFAMKAGARAPLPVAIVVGLFWGLAIMNLDRWLVTATQRRPTWRQNLFAALPRIVLALIVGAVISTPLVLWLFQREINAQLNVIHQRKLNQYEQRLLTDSRFKVIPVLEARIAKNQPIADGTATAEPTDPEVQRFQAQYDELDKQYREAQRLATCEFDGTCGTGKVGNGQAYQQKLQVAEELKRQRDEVKKRLDQAITDAKTRRQGTAANERAAAAEQLAKDKAELARLNGIKKAEQQEFAVDIGNDTGLLARLEALSELTARNGTLRTAYLLLLLFITTIEVLPVMVKFLMNLGPPTTYDEILARAERRDVETAEAQFDYDENFARFELEERRRRDEEAVRDQVQRVMVAEDEVHEQEVNQWRNEQLGEPASPSPAGSRRPFRLWGRRRREDQRYAPWPEEEQTAGQTTRTTNRYDDGDGGGETWAYDK